MRRLRLLRCSRKDRASQARGDRSPVVNSNALAAAEKPDVGGRAASDARRLEAVPAEVDLSQREFSIGQLVGMRVPRLPFVDVRSRFVELAELSWRGLVVYVYPGCETEDEGRASIRLDVVQHRTYEKLRYRFARVIPGGAVVAVSMAPPIEQRKYALDLELDPDGDERHVAHYLVEDDRRALTRAFGLPIREHLGRLHYERVTLIAREGRIRHVFVLPRPHDDAYKALTWLHLK